MTEEAQHFGHSVYDSIATSYDQDTHDAAATEFATLALKVCSSRFPGMQGLRIMDLGCGTGTLAKVLVDAGATVTGVDRSWEMLRVASQRVPDRLICGDAQRLPFRAGFDVVTACNEVVNQWSCEHLHQVFQNVNAALRPRGIFMFDALTSEHFARYWGRRHWQESRDGMRLWMDCKWHPERSEGRARLLGFRTKEGRCLITSGVLVEYWHSQPHLQKLLRTAGFTHLESMPFNPLSEPQPEGFVDRMLHVAMGGM